MRIEVVFNIFKNNITIKALKTEDLSTAVEAILIEMGLGMKKMVIQN